MPSFEYDFRFLQAGIPELKSYLLSNKIYWSLGARAPHGEPPYPRMTLGWLLLGRARGQGWQAGGLPAPRSNAFDRLGRELDTVRTRWRVAWENKAAREFSARLRLWTNFVNEYRGGNGHARRYPYEVQRRAMLDLLASEAREIPRAELDLLKGVDSFLRTALRAGGFVWDEGMSAGFPQDAYWYLYGKLKK
ncbi:MAG: hypothetical protein ACE5GO_04500 [Anaerolineales bacterium]